MLNWLSKLFRRRHETFAQHRTMSAVKVMNDDKAITVDDGEGGVASIEWADIASVTVLTNDKGPFEADLFWVLSARDGRAPVSVPMGSDGEHQLLVTMQARLAGFDNMAVVEAMSSTDNGVFQIWPPADLANSAS